MRREESAEVSELFKVLDRDQSLSVSHIAYLNQ